MCDTNVIGKTEYYQEILLALSFVIAGIVVDLNCQGSVETDQVTSFNMSTLAKWVAGSKHFNMSLHQLINNKVLYSFRIEILPDEDFPIKNLLFLLYIGTSVC